MLIHFPNVSSQVRSFHVALEWIPVGTLLLEMTVLGPSVCVTPPCTSGARVCLGWSPQDTQTQHTHPTRNACTHNTRAHVTHTAHTCTQHTRNTHTHTQHTQQCTHNIHNTCTHMHTQHNTHHTHTPHTRTPHTHTCAHTLRVSG